MVGKGRPRKLSQQGMHAVLCFWRLEPAAAGFQKAQKDAS
jgi:hypothetical protein